MLFLKGWRILQGKYAPKGWRYKQEAGGCITLFVKALAGLSSRPAAARVARVGKPKAAAEQCRWPCGHPWRESIREQTYTIQLYHGHGTRSLQKHLLLIKVATVSGRAS